MNRIWITIAVIAPIAAVTLSRFFSATKSAVNVMIAKKLEHNTSVCNITHHVVPFSVPLPPYGIDLGFMKNPAYILPTFPIAINRIQ